MAETITQANRLLEAFTPAGADVLLLNSFSGREGLSRPFQFVLDLVADVQNNMPAKVVPHNLVGKPFTIRIALETGERYLNGFCQRFAKGKQDDEFRYYTATIVPWFTFLSMASNCRIFQDKSVPDIIQQIVGEHGFSGYLTANLTKSYTSWDYCVQHRETDFAFLSRLMEAEGIYYYFQHENGKHTMMLGDDPSCYKPLPNDASVLYAPITGVGEGLKDTIRLWSSEEKIHPGKWTMRDFHHEMPHNHLEQTESSVSVAQEGVPFEVYDYTGEYAKKFNKPQSRVGSVMPEGEKLARFRMEEEEATQVEVSGWSRCRAFTSGYKINVTGGDAAGSWLLTEVTHRGVQQPAYRNRDNFPTAYDNKFSCIDSSITYKHLEQTAKPVMHGLQTAFVIDESPSGNTEEIWPDKYGRVRVRFHWDREAKYACWLRVVQPWAGKNSLYGQQWIPRVGDEVAVSFQEGDPDLPYVIGSLYNSENMPIFTLPDNKTQSGIKTHSSSGGGSSDYNMLRFEDLNGSEEIYFQAQKDHNTLIKHDETRIVKNNRTTTIHVDETRTVETGNDSIEVQKGNRTIKVDNGNISETASIGNISVTASMGNISTTADAGTIKITASAQTVTITGMTGITLSCGASSIKMTPADITINAPMVMIN